ncbi:hypothetical protein IC620_09415 [Hazenella sp. IB182357]|uniref:Uncharacterized protein n=1 Tax=Polycladospora coralii TaxID=2771432 RepID=A0A926RUH6_9BACL|nr:hypothetical protein [Polycladospora coralii]MBD1372572.1 hypothetical protein [Polycladospora coralii]MBS7531305.1 hypothetical protein [Polycladospora coralii]
MLEYHLGNMLVQLTLFSVFWVIPIIILILLLAQIRRQNKEITSLKEEVAEIKRMSMKE